MARPLQNGMRAKNTTLVLALVTGLGVVHACVGAPRWQTYEDCALLENEYNDGDSFHVKTDHWHYVFRLYFVDCPETDRSFPERVEEQAKYWEVDDARALQVGKEAAEFTRKFLRGTFTVMTRKEDARGRGDRPRYFAMIKKGDEYLSEALVSHGLARIYGYDTELPDGLPARKHWARLKVAETRAKQAHLGGWRKDGEAEPGEDRPSLAPTVEAGDLVLRTTTVVYSLDDPPRRLGLLRRGLTVRLLKAESATMVRVRFDVKGETREGQCRRWDLGL